MGVLGVVARSLSPMSQCINVRDYISASDVTMLSALREAQQAFISRCRERFLALGYSSE